MDLCDRKRNFTRRGGVKFIWIGESFGGYIVAMVTDLWRLRPGFRCLELIFREVVTGVIHCLLLLKL